MKKKIGHSLAVLGIALLLFCPIYQSIDMLVKNDDGDGKQSFGDNIVFKNILGVKTVSYYKMDGEWHENGVSIKVPLWMQRLGSPADVEKREPIGDFDNEFYPNRKAFRAVMFYRIIAKMIPLFIFIIGIVLVGTSKTEEIEKRLASS